MSHCGLCGDHINDRWVGWSVCGDCVDEREQFPTIEERLSRLSVGQRLAVLFRSFFVDYQETRSTEDLPTEEVLNQKAVEELERTS